MKRQLVLRIAVGRPHRAAHAGNTRFATRRIQATMSDAAVWRESRPRYRHPRADRDARLWAIDTRRGDCRPGLQRRRDDNQGPIGPPWPKDGVNLNTKRPGRGQPSRVPQSLERKHGSLVREGVKNPKGCGELRFTLVVKHGAPNRFGDAATRVLVQWIWISAICAARRSK